MRRTVPAFTPATRTDAPEIRPPAFSKVAVREYSRVKRCERSPSARMNRMMTTPLATTKTPARTEPYCSLGIAALLRNAQFTTDTEDAHFHHDDTTITTELIKQSVFLTSLCP